MNDPSLTDEPAHDLLVIDDRNRVWYFDHDCDRWLCPTEDGILVNWKGLTALASGLRLATPEETEEIDRELFS